MRMKVGILGYPRLTAEISEITLTFQSKLLRVLQEKEIMRVGSDKIIPIDVRIIAASNRNLFKVVSENKMREDLYYRLNVLHVHIPPLRERAEDINLLAGHIIGELEPELTDGIMQYLPIAFRKLGYHWPGNIRELHNVLERFLILARGLERYDLQVVSKLLMKCINNQFLQIPANVIKDLNICEEVSVSGKRKPDRKNGTEDIIKVLHETRGNKTEAARILGMSRMTLWRLLKKY